MTVFKTFLKVLNKCKMPIIMYTTFLIFFGSFSLKTSENTNNFVASKPDILIINNDEQKGITADLINYLETKCNLVNVKMDEDAISDALFYRDVSYIINIPYNFREDFLNKKNPKIEIKSTNDYEANLAEMILERYIKVANVYNEVCDNEKELIDNINNTLSYEVNVQINAQIDTTSIEKMATYYNFANYCLLAGCIYVIGLILSSFKSEKIKKRTIISSINFKKYNRQLLLSNSLFAFTLWAFYVILSFLLLGSIMWTLHGLMFIINSFIFTFCALTLSFLIGNLVTNKNALNGIVNVIALGSSFLCGAFVPMQLLPNSVLKIAHILPSYWYIKTNELLKNIEIFNFNSIKSIAVNMIILTMFGMLFIVITNILASRKNRID